MRGWYHVICLWSLRCNQPAFLPLEYVFDQFVSQLMLCYVQINRGRPTNKTIAQDGLSEDELPKYTY